MSEPIVTLGMYGAGPGTDERFWAGLRQLLVGHGFAGVLPRYVTVDGVEAEWLNPNLLLAQTCGYPLVTRLAGKVRYLTTPIYQVEGSEGGFNRSAIVVRADEAAQGLRDLKGRRAVYNAEHSHSGYNVFRYEVSSLANGEAFFSSATATGSHLASAQAVVAGEADVAAIDPVTWALMPNALRSGLRVLAWSAPAPGLPFITAGRVEAKIADTLRQGLETYLGTAEAAQDLPVIGSVTLPPAAYETIEELEQVARDRQYPVLA